MLHKAITSSLYLTILTENVPKGDHRLECYILDYHRFLYKEFQYVLVSYLYKRFGSKFNIRTAIIIIIISKIQQIVVAYVKDWVGKVHKHFVSYLVNTRRFTNYYYEHFKIHGLVTICNQFH